MKRSISLLLAVLTVLSLCACGKIEEAKAADEKILQIGKVSVESSPEIEEARQLVDALDEKERASLENHQLLLEAESAYDALKAQEVTDAIEKLRDVNVPDAEEVDAARKMYSELTEAQKALVTNYGVLEEAENIISNIQDQTLLDALTTPDYKKDTEEETVSGVLDSVSSVTDKASDIAEHETLDAERFDACLPYYCAWLVNGNIFPRVYYHFVNGSEKTISNVILAIQIRNEKGELVNLNKYADSPVYQALLLNEGPYKKDEGERTIDTYYSGYRWKDTGTLEVMGMIIFYTDNSYEVFGHLNGNGRFDTKPAYLNDRTPKY